MIHSVGWVSAGSSTEAWWTDYTTTTTHGPARNRIEIGPGSGIDQYRRPATPPKEIQMGELFLAGMRWSTWLQAWEDMMKDESGPRRTAGGFERS